MANQVNPAKIKDLAEVLQNRNEGIALKELQNLFPPSGDSLDKPKLKTGQAAIIKELKDRISKKEFCDLHTHLLGMGDASFWVDKVFLEKLSVPYVQEVRNNRK